MKGKESFKKFLATPKKLNAEEKALNTISLEPAEFPIRFVNFDPQAFLRNFVEELIVPARVRDFIQFVLYKRRVIDKQSAVLQIAKGNLMRLPEPSNSGDHFLKIVSHSHMLDKTEFPNAVKDNTGNT
uniref:Uncharacterized protein n=1 Tax=Glossina austeni TaxID=7395 RepID=A0A1A9UWQ6_GLOAU